LARNDTHRIVQRYNEGVRAYRQARAQIRREDWGDSEVSLRAAATQSVGALEWALKAHLRHPLRSQRMVETDQPLLKQPTFEILIRLLGRYSEIQLNEETIDSLFSHRRMRNEVEHGGVIPSIPAVEASLTEIGDIIGRLVAIDPSSLSQVFPDRGGSLGSARIIAHRFLEVRPAIPGREFELSGARALLEGALKTRAGRLILLGGKSGSGKTHLAHEICRIADELGYDVAATACEPFQEGVVLYPVAEILRQLSGHTSPSVAVEELYPSASSEVSMARLADETNINASERRGAYLASFANALYGRFRDARSNSRPILVFVDDMEWLETATSDALLCLRGRFSEGPIVILGAYRTDLVTARRNQHPLHPLLNLASRYPEEAASFLIEGLSKGTIPEAVEGILGGPSDLSPSQYDRLFAETEGNPLFLREILRALTADCRGGPPPLKFADGVWRLGHEFGHWKMPATIEEAIQSRLECLSQEQQVELEKAAVVGRHFAYMVMLELSGQPEDDFLEDLDRLLRFDVIRELEDSADVVFEFTHGKIRDVIYERISRLKRRAMHRTVAGVLKALRPRLKLPNFDALVGAHLHLAGQLQESIPYLLKAARTSTSLFAIVQATEQFERALGACLETGFPNDEDEWSIRTQYGEVLRQAGRFDDAIAMFSAILERNGDPRWQGEALNRVGDLYWLKGDSDKALNYYARCEAIARENGFQDLLLEVAADFFEFHDREAERLAGLSPSAAVAHRATADRYLDEQLHLALRSEDPRARSRAYRNEAKRLRRRGDIDSALRRYEDALALAGPSGADHSILISYAKTLRFAGRTSEASEIVQRVLDWGIQTGARRTEAIGRQYAALLQLESAESDSIAHARREVMKAISLHREIGYARGLRESQILLGECYALEGSWDRALDAFSAALAGDAGADADSLVASVLAQLETMDETARADRLRRQPRNNTE